MMNVIPQVTKQSRVPQLEDAGAPQDEALCFGDVEAFVNAKSETDLEGLMGKYSDPLQPLYGLIETEWIEDAHTVKITPPSESETVNDFLNLKNLLTKAMRLCALLEHSDISRQDIEESGIEIAEHDTDVGLILTYKIELESENVTRQFLEAGIENARLGFHTCYTSECPGSLEEASTFFLIIISQVILETPKSLHRACEDIFNTLSMIMMHDVSIGIEGRELPLLSRSTASSLWSLLLEGFQEGRADCCRVCGKPFIALDERKNKRLYCSGACNKMHQRFSKYDRFIKEGYLDTEAAKKAGVDLARARLFWETHRHQRPIG
jgi:hypothetical protein